MYKQNNIMGEQIKNNKIVIRISNETKNEYKILCESLGYTYSKRILSLIKKDIENLKSNGKL